MQIKATLRLHFTYSRTITKNAGEDVVKKKDTIVEMKISTTTMEKSIQIPQKVKDRTTISSSDTTSGHLSKRV
jgi:hypothetical protein